MIIRSGILLLFLTCVQTTNHYNDREYSAYTDNYELPIYSQSLKARKREAVAPLPESNDIKNETNTKKDVIENVKPESLPNAIGPSEGGGAIPQSKSETNSTNIKSDATKVDNKLEPQNDCIISYHKVWRRKTEACGSTCKRPLSSSGRLSVEKDEEKNITSNSTINALKVNETLSTTPKQNETAVNSSTTIDMASELQNPGVVKRGLIVFGGFALLAVAYFVFYRKKSKNYDANNTHNTNDTNQFRYGVLQSDDRRDNLELSRIPLTMESDEDDEEDLEIFDLEQKKKSLSYVNLQTNDEDLVLQSSKDESKNNLLLDIEDGPSDTLINWSNTSSNSIL